MEFKKTVAVDFDGVLNEYSGYDPDDLYAMKEGADEFLEALARQYTVIIYSTRPSDKITRWLKENKVDQYITRVTNIKPPAVAYIDDRAVRFNGDYTELLEVFTEKAYWEK